jgi:3'-phosphoadenosine 5'-phosphosulfate sulfotransferase (PAPS reductase)/FAD synthetase
MESPIPLLTQIDGTRRAEASRRDGRDVGVIIGGQEVSRTETPLYLEKGMFGRNFIYPIYDWTDEQVWATILLYSLPISREYFKW